MGIGQERRRRIGGEKGCGRGAGLEMETGLVLGFSPRARLPFRDAKGHAQTERDVDELVSSTDLWPLMCSEPHPSSTHLAS